MELPYYLEGVRVTLRPLYFLDPSPSLKSRPLSSRREVSVVDGNPLQPPIEERGRTHSTMCQGGSGPPFGQGLSE